MTTREIYFKILIECDLPLGLAMYTYKDNSGVIQVGNNIPLFFSTDELVVSDAIRQMKEIENIDGFMFWNASLEGEEFLKSIKIIHNHI
jgi:hypothetical protein